MQLFLPLEYLEAIGVGLVPDPIYCCVLWIGKLEEGESDVKEMAGGWSSQNT